MSLIVGRRAGTRQQQGAITYRRETLQQYGICGGFLAHPADPFPLAVNGSAISATELIGNVVVPAFAGSPYGVANIASNSVAWHYLVPTGSPSTQSFTLLARVRTSAAGVFGRGGTTLPLWRNSGTFDMRINGTDYAGAGTWTAGRWYDIEIVGTDSACQLYVNGTLTINGGAASAGSIAASIALGADGAGGGGGQINCMYYLWANRPLGSAERVQIRANPWALIEERFAFRVPAAAAVPTLSASTYAPGSLNSGGWIPRVTAT